MTKALKEYVKFPQSIATNRIHTRRFRRKGYRFLGWNTKKDGTGYWYPDASPIYTDSDNDKTEVNEPLNLYAQWDNTVDTNEGTVYEYTAKPFYNVYGMHEDCKQLPLATAFEKQLVLCVSGKIKTEPFKDISSTTTSYRTAILMRVQFVDTSKNYYGVFVRCDFPTLKIVISNGNTSTKETLEYTVGMGDVYTASCRVDKKRLVFYFKDFTKGFEVSRAVDIPDGCSVYSITQQGEGKNGTGAPLYNSEPSYRYYSAEYDLIHYFVDYKLANQYKPVTLLQDHTFNNGSFTKGTSGFVDIVTSNFYTNTLIDDKGVTDGWITVAKPSGVDSVTVTYTGVNPEFQNYPSADSNTTKTDNVITSTLSSGCPYVLIKDTIGAQDDSSYAHFEFSDKVELYGKISALNGGNTTVNNEYQFYRMFADQPILTAPEIDITNTTKWCLAETFSGCMYLKESPAITVDKVVTSALSGAFMDCTSLRKAGKITVSSGEVEEYSMNSIFAGDTSLTEMADLTSITKAGYKALDSAFSDCECLKKKDLLPVGDLESHWNDYMFDNTGIKDFTESVEEIEKEGRITADTEDTNVEEVNLWNNSIATSN